MRVTFIERAPAKWRIRIETGVDAAGNRLFRYETISGTRDDAERRRFTILNEHEEGSFSQPEKVTFGKFFEQWIEGRRALETIRRTTIENYLSMYRTHMQPIAGKRVQKITSQDIQQIYVRMARAGSSKSTINQLHKIIVAAFRAIRRANLVKANIMEEIEAPPRPKNKPKAITAEAASALIETLAGKWFEGPALLALATGLRRGEICGLRWGDVELDVGRLHVRGQIIEYHDNSAEWVAAKTDAGERTISIDGDTVDMLRRLRIAAAEFRLRSGLGGKLTDDTLVFTRPTGEHLKPRSLGRAFTNHCAAHGLDGFTFHGTRHTHLTALLARVGKAGAKAVSQRAGHADLSTTLSIYQTVFEADDRNLADLTASMFKRRP